MPPAVTRFGLLAALLLLTGVAQAGLGLTQAEVKHYLQTRIEVADLQNDYKANADKYDNVVQAFYRAREHLVKERGYADGAAFDRMKMRIWAAYNNMDEYQQSEHERQRMTQLEKNRADWPAVRHYREAIDALTNWYNGNTDKRPVVK